MLILDPTPPTITWHHLMDNDVRSGQLQTDQTPDGQLQAICSETGDVACVLQHGADQFTHALTLITNDDLPRLEACLPFGQPANDLTLQCAQAALQAGSRLETQTDRHVFILCETALFSRLPAALAAYALPYDLFQRGIRRYGAAGLTHAWALEQAGEIFPQPAARLITIHIAEHTTLAAFQDGVAVQTSAGFSELEGMPGVHTSGSIDPSIPLHLAHKGIPPDEINRQLSFNSGLAALAGQNSRLEDILMGSSPGCRLARRQFCHQLVRFIGSMSADLGGVDALLFSSANTAAFLPVIEETCRHFDFAGLKLHSDSIPAGNAGVISTAQASIQAAVLTVTRQDVLRHATAPAR